jgi:membrane protein
MLETKGAPRADMNAIWSLLKDTVSRWWGLNTRRLGASLAYFTVLSLAPLLVVVIAIAGLAFGPEAARGQILWQIGDLVGPEGAAAIQSMLENAQKPATGVIAGIFGIAALLFGASGVFFDLQDSLNTVWGVKSSSAGGLMGMLRYRFTSFAMVLGIGFLLLVSLVLSAFLAAAGRYFERLLPAPEALLYLANLAISFAAITLLFALIYKLVPDTEIAWRDVWVGAAVTALLFTAGKFVIGLYLGKAGLGSAYGAAGSLVVMLAWVYYSAQIFFLGAEFTHSFAERHGSKAAQKDEAEAARQHQEQVKRFRQPRLA